MVWERVTYSGKNHAIFFIDTVFRGYQTGVIKDFFLIAFNPTHYRQFNGARWWLKEEIDSYVSALRNKEKNSPGFLLQKAEEYERLNQGFFEWSRQYKNLDFKHIDNKKIAIILSEFANRLTKINALVYTSIMVDRFYTDEIVRLIAKKEPTFNKQQEYLNIIFSIEWGLETHYEKESLIDIAEKLQKKPVSPDVTQLIEKHLGRFAHLNFMPFYRPQSDKESVLEAIKNLLEKDIKKEKVELEKQKRKSKKVEELKNLLALDDKEVLKIKTIRKWAFIANNDDHYVMGAICALWGLWQEIARRFSITFEQFVEMRIDEIKETLRNGAISNELRDELPLRCQDNAMIWDERGTRLLVGDALVSYYNDEKIIEEDFHKIMEVKGLPASQGKALGIVRLLLDIRDLNKVEKDNVLVAVYTYPAIVVAMEKASAIVTDQGGLLSHAAIVSREMHKPCIVGTGIATRVFKDGDLVEVDATNGIVKRIK
ncbi:MAG: PEP-utilizing enzyme [Candidatus Woesearchaeota archaeon]